MSLFFLLFPLFVEAKPWPQVWEVRLSAAPRAAFYDAAGGEILVSVEGASVRAISLQGKLDEEARAEESGKAGPMRAYGGRVYWAVGKTIYSFPSGGGRLRKEAEASAPVKDLALGLKGQLSVAGEKGVGAPGKESGAAAQGLFNWISDLFVLRGGKVSGNGKEKRICQSCEGLERAPNGEWITAEGKRILRGKTVLAEGKSTPGRIAYAYQRDSRYDLLIVPYPEEKIVRAYQAETEKP